MVKRTPGPWEVRHDHPEYKTACDLAFIRPASAPREYDPAAEIASVHGCTYLIESPGNAFLIAAAPCLLEALEMVRDSGIESMPAAARQKIDAAIARATGEQS